MAFQRSSSYRILSTSMNKQKLGQLSWPQRHLAMFLAPCFQHQHCYEHRSHKISKLSSVSNLKTPCTQEHLARRSSTGKLDCLPATLFLDVLEKIFGT
ncbi:hypothetical protein FOVG_17005 [Fusarium oxysporum f. sp. pisi HDV247]|uniref:Uncharacterized protein n=1 Tax=Fusarium oxysporum f. sp. pisi HDV247 TaxID=1080344 RepID=W9NFY0_FUSOX|nr:hypothetical protein FOVG_17005 [Fusarium oxysporum f. sp. pisi HDV247]